MKGVWILCAHGESPGTCIGIACNYCIPLLPEWPWLAEPPGDLGLGLVIGHFASIVQPAPSAGVWLAASQNKALIPSAGKVRRFTV